MGVITRWIYCELQFFRSTNPWRSILALEICTCSPNSSRFFLPSSLFSNTYHSWSPSQSVRLCILFSFYFNFNFVFMEYGLMFRVSFWYCTRLSSYKWNRKGFVWKEVHRVTSRKNWFVHEVSRGRVSMK